jgi:hypothetical protein
MEFDDLLENEKFKASIGLEKHALYSGDDGQDLMWESFSQEWVPVLILKGEDSDFCFRIRKWHGFYFYDDENIEGVADSIENIFNELELGSGSFQFRNPVLNTNFDSSDISLERLKTLANRLIDKGELIVIDGKDYKKVGGKIVEVS